MALDLSDKSPNGNNLTNFGATVGAAFPGITGNTQSASFVAASSQYMTAPDSVSLDFSTAVTIEAWVKISAFGAENQTIVAKGRADGDVNARYEFRVDSTRNISLVYASSGPVFHTFQSTAAQVTAGTPVHIAISYTYGTGSSAQFYVNGATVTGSWIGGNGNGAVLSESTILEVGRIHITSGTPLEFMDGLMGELRIWNLIRSGAQISANYQNRLTGSEIGLAAYYPFESLSTLKGSNPLLLGII